MKVMIEFETEDAQGEIMTSQVPAMLEVRRSDYRLVYVENLSSGEKTNQERLTRSTMLLSEGGMRITRTGELNTDFMYAKAMVHNTTYGTPYGAIPVTLETEDYHFWVGRTGGEPLGGIAPNLPEDFLIQVEAVYKLIMAGQEPLDMRIKLRIQGVSEKQS